MITEKTENGSTSRQDLVDAANGIPLPQSGKIDLCLVCKTEQVINKTQAITRKSKQVVTLSLSLLGRVSKEEYLDQLKKKNGDVKVLSQTDSSATIQERGSIFAFSDPVEKTIIAGDVVLQIKFWPNRGEPVLSTPFYRMFEKITFAP